MKKTYILIATIALTLAVTVGLAIGQQTDAPPADAQYAIAVATDGIMYKGEHQLAEVSKQAQQALNADTFAYNGFKPGNVFFHSYGVGPSGENSRSLQALIQFIDANKRASNNLVIMDYLMGPNQFDVNNASMTVIEPSIPRVDIFFVPTRIINDAGQSIYQDWETLFTFAKQNAVKPGQPSEREQHYGFIFCLDRTASDAKFYPIVSRRKNERNIDKSIAKTTTLDFEGWKVAVIAGRLALGSATKFYANIMYKPGKFGLGDTNTRIAAKFDSKTMVLQSMQSEYEGPQLQKSQPGQGLVPEGTPTPAPIAATAPTPQPAPAATPAAKPNSFKEVIEQQQAPAAPAPMAPAPAPMAAPAPAPAAAPAPTAAPAATASVQGPLERGMAFLNPVFPDDVAIIQNRLTTLGHYGGPIDKNFGPFTKKALDNFAVKNGFPKGQWSLGLQKALFRGSGL